MEYTNDGSGALNGGGQTDEAPSVEKMRELAENARRNATEYITRGKELVIQYPAYALAGAVAAGFLFARLVARRR